MPRPSRLPRQRPAAPVVLPANAVTGLPGATRRLALFARVNPGAQPEVARANFCYGISSLYKSLGAGVVGVRSIVDVGPLASPRGFLCELDITAAGYDAALAAATAEDGCCLLRHPDGRSLGRVVVARLDGHPVQRVELSGPAEWSADHLLSVLRVARVDVRALQPLRCSGVPDARWSRRWAALIRPPVDGLPPAWSMSSVDVTGAARQYQVTARDMALPVVLAPPQVSPLASLPPGTPQAAASARPASSAPADVARPAAAALPVLAAPSSPPRRGVAATPAHAPALAVPVPLTSAPPSVPPPAMPMPLTSATASTPPPDSSSCPAVSLSVAAAASPAGHVVGSSAPPSASRPLWQPGLAVGFLNRPSLSSAVQPTRRPAASPLALLKGPSEGVLECAVAPGVESSSTALVLASAASKRPRLPTQAAGRGRGRDALVLDLGGPPPNKLLCL